jgi:hypothetical protein
MHVHHTGGPARAPRVDVSEASRRWRRLWTALQLLSIPYAILALMVLVVIGMQLASGRILFGSSNLAAQLIDPDQAALVLALLVSGPLALLAVGRFSIRGIVAGTVLAIVTAAALAWDVWANDRIVDREVVHLLIAASAIALTVVVVMSVAQLSRGALGAGFGSAPRVGSDFATAVRRRRQTYHQVRWGRSYLLVLAALVFPLLWAASSYLIGFIAIHAIGVPRAVYDLSSQSKETWDGIGTWPILALVVMDAGKIVLTLGGTYLAWRAAWRRVRRGAEEVVGDTDYRPLVFLRSFQDEEARVAPRSTLRRLLRRGVRLEEVLVNKVSRLGPAVAIGLPGERVQKLGAFRAYYNNEDWQRAVLGWMSRAYVIVVIGGTSPWALWELQHILTHGLAQRLILIVPPDGSDTERQARWDALCWAASRTPWEGGLRGMDPGRVIAVVFEPDGGVLPIFGSAKHQADYELALQLATLALIRRRRKSTRQRMPAATPR